MNKIVTVNLIVFSLFLPFLFGSCFVSAELPSITRVQSNFRAATTSSPTSVTLAQTPQVGDVLVAVVGSTWTGSGTPQVASVFSQTGASWIGGYSSATSSASSGSNLTVCWGIVKSASAAKTVTIDFKFTHGSGSISSATADVCEYQGIDTDYLQRHNTDLAISDGGLGTQISTHPQGSTHYMNELWVGGALLTGFSQSNPTNQFQMFDGSVENGISVSYLDKIVSTTGTAQLGTTGAGSGSWRAVIVTLPASPTLTITPSAGATGTDRTVTVTGTGFGVNTFICAATFDGQPITLGGSTTTNSTGGFTITFTVPASKLPGIYQFTATDAVHGLEGKTTYTVTPSIPLPESPIAALSALAASLVGAAVWAKSKKR